MTVIHVIALCMILAACSTQPVHTVTTADDPAPIACAHGALHAVPGSFAARHNICQTPGASVLGQLPTL